MTEGILEVLGGIGLFLLGMAVMTDGLNRLAGESLRKTLATFTKNPFTGAMTGMVVTALVQSSSATTVMAVGFVGAGLLTFPQALGIIFGANIGTTATGWIVALWGFTLSLKNVALPMLFVGAMLRLIRGTRLAALGYAIAGFGAVFIGIGMLQHGMEAFKDTLSPDSFPPDTFIGRLLLLIVGFAITLVTQSSSAGVAAAITALHVGNISLSQAAAMVIGMDIGTTATALLASLGGNVNARRTGWSHVIYNVVTGAGAFLLLPVYIRGLDTWLPTMQSTNPELALVGFHSLFNALGVALILPFTSSFVALIMYLVPSGESKLTERLEPSLLKQPQVAIENVLATLNEIAQAVFAALASLLSSSDSHKLAWARIDEAEKAVAETRVYLSQVNDPVAVEKGFSQKIAAVHILDHLARLIVRIRKQGRLEAVLAEEELSKPISQLVDVLGSASTQPEHIEDTHRELKKLWSEIVVRSDRYRDAAIERTVMGRASFERLMAQLDGVRWLQRVIYHTLRITHYLSHPTSITRDHEESESEQFEEFSQPSPD